ncbi:MAG: hypothetical protein JXL81_01335 [Deltaproteobacteria bacterium]|nr:hypothetical protein [Deltaproteobacteria bacterium]
MLNNVLKALVLITIFFIINPPASKGERKFIIDGTVYLRVNIHYQEDKKDNETSYASWIDPKDGHKILPVNTPVKIKKWGSQSFKIINTENNTEIEFKYLIERMKMSREEYLKYITSPSRISLDDLSDIDRNGIKEGKAFIGMTKDCILMALGYPATHRTPSLKSNTWVYWKDRSRTTAITFDQNGIVARISE